ncbi:MAG: DHA2 family efflux MFS transporter permease subunit, partial [Thermomonas sp.]
MGLPPGPEAAAKPSDFRPPNVALTTLGLALASFMQVLDTTIANVSLPTISGNLGGSANQATWVITSFAVSNAIALPLTGWLTRKYGERKLFMWSTLAFVMASFLCGIAHSMGLLVTARALQGFVAGPMYPVTQALLLSIYPPARRGQAIALLAMVTVVAPIAGPILGGWITDNYSWEWIFFINVPVGILAIALALKFVPVLPTHDHKFDLLGVALSAVGLFCIVFGIQEGQKYDWGTGVWILIGVGLLVFAGFVYWQSVNTSEPLVPLALFRDRNFSLSNIGIAAM